MRILLALILTIVAGGAIAGDTYAFQRGIVGTGDSVGQLIQKAGEPSRIVRLENSRGAAVGERWEYYLRDKQVSVTVSGGRIVGIDEVR